MSSIVRIGCLCRIPSAASAVKPLDIAGSHIYMVAGTAGKCIQGFPGVSFVLLRKGFLERMRGVSQAIVVSPHDPLCG